VPVSRGLRRLLRIRELEEEQRRLALDAAREELGLLEQAMRRAGERGACGRRLLLLTAGSGAVADRLSALEESRASERHSAALVPKIAGAEDDVETLREEFLAARVERRQAETLVEEAQAREAAEVNRRSQQALDDWFGARHYRERRSAAPAALQRKSASKPSRPSSAPGRT
jgi:flagellar biosynthesis chaperone FliJ